MGVAMSKAQWGGHSVGQCAGQLECVCMCVRAFVAVGGSMCSCGYFSQTRMCICVRIIGSCSGSVRAVWQPT